MELRAGEVAVFSANAIHGSAANRSGAARFAILHDYTPAVARQSVGIGSGQLVRGRDAFGHFAHEPVPSSDFEANVRMRRRILTEYPENILMGPLAPGARPTSPTAARCPRSAPGHSVVAGTGGDQGIPHETRDPLDA